jgi:hypothetical protein
MKRSEGRVRGTLALAGRHLMEILDYPNSPAPDYVTGEEEEVFSAMPSASSPLDNTGPFPAELLADSRAEAVVPWNIEVAEIKKDVARQRLVWMAALAVSWSATFVAVLRVLGLL